MLPEAPRDQQTSPFTPLLRHVMQIDPAVIAVVFVDGEGECVDYCSRLDPFDAKLAGAQLRVELAKTSAALARLGWGEVIQIEISGGERQLWVRRVGASYAVVAVRQATGDATWLPAALSRAVQLCSREAALDIDASDLVAPSVFVETRRATGWGYAPVAFSQAGWRTELAAVLGCWKDELGGVGYRVRTDGGQELTLVHDSSLGCWQLRD